MRKSKTPASEIEAQELADAKASRKGGLSLKEIRDRGWGRLRDHNGSSVIMVWNLGREDRMFKLIIGDKTIVLDWEEVQKFGRWI